MANRDRYSEKHTLCEYCWRAYGRCSWSDRGEPVHGWKAQKSNVSYCVIECPKFIPDAIMPRPKAKDINLEGCLVLMEYAMRYAKSDYISNRNHDRAEVTRFIRTIASPERASQILYYLKQEAKKHDDEVAAKEAERERKLAELKREKQRKKEMIERLIKILEVYLDAKALTEELEE